jgi:hypothetical protein
MPNLPEWLHHSVNDRYNIDGLLKSAQLKQWVTCLIAGAENWQEDQYIQSKEHSDWWEDNEDNERTYKAVGATLSYAKNNPHK